jgi:peptidyl-prolyl isomerase H (cyclophilin H)
MTAMKSIRSEASAVASSRQPLDVLDAVPVPHVKLSSPSNPVVFLDISVNHERAARVKLELYADKVPKVAENFRQLCTGETKRGGMAAGYRGTSFHRVVPNFIVQGGDLLGRDGAGSFSIYGDTFTPDPAALSLKHDAPGILSMATAGSNVVGCQFLITTQPAPKLDGSYPVVGKVISGMEVIRQLENVGLNGATPNVRCVVEQCGQL